MNDNVDATIDSWPKITIECFVFGKNDDISEVKNAKYSGLSFSFVIPKSSFKSQ